MDGVGDEVLGLLVSVLATFLVAVLWKTTQVQLETLHIYVCKSFENHKLCITMYMYILPKANSKLPVLCSQLLKILRHSISYQN